MFRCHACGCIITEMDEKATEFAKVPTGHDCAHNAPHLGFRDCRVHPELPGSVCCGYLGGDARQCVNWKPGS